jgi:hypothetical protein
MGRRIAAGNYWYQLRDFTMLDRPNALNKYLTSIHISESEMRRMTDGSMRYAGFVPRLKALLVDCILLSPLLALNLWGTSNVRMWPAYEILPQTLFFFGTVFTWCNAMAARREN